MFEDVPVIEQLWRGYAFTVNNLYYQLYQLDLSKCVHTIPWQWISDWEVFTLDTTTNLAELTLPNAAGGLSESLVQPEDSTDIILANLTVADIANTVVVLNGCVQPAGFTLVAPRALRSTIGTILAGTNITVLTFVSPFSREDLLQPTESTDITLSGLSLDNINNVIVALNGSVQDTVFNLVSPTVLRSTIGAIPAGTPVTVLSLPSPLLRTDLVQSVTSTDIVLSTMTIDNIDNVVVTLGGSVQPAVFALVSPTVLRSTVGAVLAGTIITILNVAATPAAPTSYPYAYRMPFGVKDATILRESPREIVNLPPNTYLGADNILVLPDGTRRHSTDKIYLPTDVLIDGDKLYFPRGVPVDCEKLYPNIDYKTEVRYESPCGGATVYYDTPRIRFKVEPYTRLWSNLAVRDLEIIYENFGSLIEFYKPDSYRYLREVQGMWFAFWNGAAINNLCTGINILKDLPFALEDGIVDSIIYTGNSAQIGTHTYTITDAQAMQLHSGDVVTSVNAADRIMGLNWDPIKLTGPFYRLSAQSIDNMHVGDVVSNVIPSSAQVILSGTPYPIAGNAILNVVEGEYVKQFTPITKMVGVFDYINYPGWWKEYTGNYVDYESACFFDGYPYFDVGRFDLGYFDDTYSERCLEAIFMQYFTFLVKVDQSVWFRSREEFLVVVAFLLAIKPAYTHFIFEMELNFADDTAVLDDKWGMSWNYVPIDIPLDHHHFDEVYIHPTFDDGAYFDFNEERDYLRISVFGSPEVFNDSCATGFTFDDPAVPTFDYHRPGIMRELRGYDNPGEFPHIRFDSDPYQDSLEFEWHRKIPSLLTLSEGVQAEDADLGIEPALPPPPGG